MSQPENLTQDEAATGERENNTGTPWNCPNGHLVGHIIKHDTPRPSVISNMLHTTTGYIIEGHAWLPCPECGTVMEWHFASAMMRKLLERNF